MCVCVYVCIEKHNISKLIKVMVEKGSESILRSG